MKKALLLLLAAGMMSTSAMARDEIVTTSMSTTEARLLGVTPEVQPVPLKVEVEVIGKRIHRKIILSKEELAKRVVNNDYERTVENLRSYAVYLVSGIYDCDLIVGARFNFELVFGDAKDAGATVEIFGYPANFVNWGGSVKALRDAPVVDNDYGQQKGSVEIQ